MWDSLLKVDMARKKKKKKKKKKIMLEFQNDNNFERKSYKSQ